MGLFDKMKNYVTGGHAAVTIEIPQVAFVGMPISVKVACMAKASFDCNGVYVDVGATESVEVDPPGDAPKITQANVTHSNQLLIHGPFSMKEGETKEFTATVTLPREVQPTYKGKLAKHTVQLQARLDTKGNDPDSGWKELRVGVMS